MAEKYQYIEELASISLKQLCQKNNWIDYLRIASNHYKYSFRDSLLIYAQRPDAIAVASFDLWNNVMHRYVNKGSKGIALINHNGGKPSLHYVFDISDTHGDRIPYVWQFKDEYIDRINQELKDSFEVEGDLGNFDSIIGIAAASIIEDNMPELVSELKYSKENSFLEEFDDQNLEMILKNTIYESVITTVFLRCGYDIDIEENISYEFSQLYNFNTPDTMILLGTAVSDISETILREIELSVKTIEREERNQERGKLYGDKVQGSGRADVPRYGNQGTDRRAVDEVWQDAEALSGTEPSDKIQPDDIERNTIPALQGSGNPDEKPDELGGRTAEEADRTEVLADNDIGDRERADSGAYIDGITEQDDIDAVLLSGSGFAEGKQRIIDYFFENTSNTERAAFLKEEYGIGGGSVYFASDRTGFQNHNSRGIEIFSNGFRDDPIKLTWSEAAERIGKLIETGRYYDPINELEKLLIKPTAEENMIKQGAEEAPFFMEEKRVQPSSKKRKSQTELNYDRLNKIVPHIMDKRYRYAKLEADGFMDLTIEWIGSNRISITHYGEQNGDLMADPDMELIIDFDKKEILPATFQNDYIGIYQEVYSDNNQWRPELSRELTTFLNTWLKNIEFQGHVIAEAVYFNDELAENQIAFDRQGREYGFDVSHDLLSIVKTAPEITSQDRQVNKEYTVGTVLRTHFKEKPSTSIIITGKTEDEIHYIFPDILEQESVNMERQVFEKYLQSGEITFNSYQPTVPQDVKDTILRGGGNDSNSITRIIAHYTKDKSSTENIDFLSNEFAKSNKGKGYIVDGIKYAVWFDYEGIRIAKGDSALHNSKFIPFTQVDERIKELLYTGSYAEQAKIDEASEFELQETAQSLWYMWQDVAGEYRYILNDIKDLHTGHFPNDITKLKESFQESQLLQAVINSVTELQNEYAGNPDVMRFRIYTPFRVLQLLKDLQIDRLQFSANASIPYPQMYITQDEIDSFFVKHGSGVAEGKYRIFSYFLNNEDSKDRIAFLKDEYGIGGYGYTGYNESHDSKGIVFKREHEKRVYDTVNLTWSNVAKRIDSLIKSDRYMSQKELEYIHEYERNHIARQIYNFYYRRPQEVERPYPYGEEYTEATENIKKQLENPESVSSMLNQMSKVMEKTSSTDRDFEVMNCAYVALQQYAAGTFSLFGIKTTQVTEPIIESNEEQIESGTNDLSEIEGDSDSETLIFDDNGEYNELFRSIMKQGTVTVNGKNNIIDIIDSGLPQEQLAKDIKEEYGDFWSEITFDDENIRWHASDEGLDVFVNGWNNPVIRYDWDTIVNEIISLHENNKYLDHQVKESPATQTPEAVRSTELQEGMSVSLDDRKYSVEKLDAATNKVELKDITFDRGIGFPINRIEKLNIFEAELEQDGFFNKEESIESSQEKINYHITNDDLGIGGAKEKYQRNMAAIKLLKQIESENRFATAEEQDMLAQYVGWGGIAKAFDEMDTSWSHEYVELKELLGDDEYKAARSSVLTAYYTPPVVIKAMYKALDSIGFQGGNILEPAMGIGNFMGLIPPSLSDSKMYGVELDSISGRIAKQLYQRENIQVTGLEHTAFHDNFFDVAIGNIPFGSYGVSDKKYDKHNFMIHDYFLAKALDKVRPGGIVAFITSKGTLDKKNSSVRKYLAQRAELVGAVRLPNNAFKANAGTEVTSDIIFLKKRDSLQDIEPDWVQLGQTQDGLPINQYFVNNPHMILGSIVKQVGIYGSEEIACAPFEGKELGQQLYEAISYVQAEIDDNYYMIDEPDMDDTSIPADPNVKNYSFTLVDEKLYYRENSRMNLFETNSTAEKRIKAMIALSNTLHTLIDYQLNGYGEYEIRKMQSRLDGQYNGFEQQFGRINDRANRLAFSEDSSYYLLSSLENLDENGNFIGKADIFTKQTIRPRIKVTHVDTSSEALAVSISDKAKVDIGYMSSLTGKAPETVIEDLKGVIFKDPLSDLNNPYEGYLTADEYLSGNVRDKLKTAQLIAETHPEFVHHLPALEAVQPEDLEAGDIEVRLGTVWIPTNYIEDFMFELLETSYYGKRSIEVEYSKHSGSWYISNKSMKSYSIAASETYGTKRINAYQIIEETLNQKNVRITDKVIHPDGKEEYVLNKKETFLATQKQNLIKEAFRDWIFKDEKRRKHLVDYYNENFNNIRPREYDGEHLVFEGMNPVIELRPHQRNAVARQLYGGNTLLAHVVGAGKSFTMIAAAMESKRLGLSTKNMITVPNHLTEQIASETLRLYPSAKVLVATKKDFQKHNRKRFCSKIATGDYDIIIIGHSQFEKVPLSIERQIRTIEKEIDEIAYSISSERRYGAASFNVKQMERTKKSLEKMLERLNDQSRKDDVVTFEELGIDRLFVDESHGFKNLFVYTKMRNVAGVQQTQAQKAMDMYMKCKYLDEITGGKGITFATGTPVSNSMTELFTMQRYLQMHELEKRDLHHFDNWASVFGETQTAYELAPEGDRFRMKTRFSKFHNLPELMSMFKEIADIQTNDMLNLPIPELRGGKIHNITVKATEIQRTMIAELGERADAVRNGEVEPTEDNMLKITNDGRKIALDQRLANVCLPDDPNSKVNALMINVLEIWEREADEKGTQIVFCDMSTPKFNGEFNVYEDLKKKWVEQGIPEEQIAFIHETKNERQKASMFAKVRSGDIRIILGSTFMMGSGVNIQDRLKAVHHADVGWKPSSMEQRNGRILRQGNMYDEVEIYRYITENTFDSYSWQLLEQKQRFISQIMTSKAPVRSADDIDDSVLSYAEVKALATGNPLIKERMELDVEVGKLKMLKAEHKNRTYRLQEQISTRLPEKIKAIELRIKGYEADIQTAASFIDKDFSMSLNGIAYDDKKKAGEMILALSKQVHQISGKTVGEYKGFPMTINADSLFKAESYIELKGAISHKVYLGDDSFGNITRLDNAIKGFEEQLKHYTDNMDNTKKQLESAKKEVEKPFPQEFELKQKTARLNELNHELSMDKKEDVQDIGEDDKMHAENSIANYSLER